ncbi:MAG: hypothetical protein J6Z14_13320 [Prevotella sp.]|nr:hypothetical protein [Prevotella sp.]
MAKKTKQRSYSSLEEILMRKEQLTEVIHLEDREIKRLWTDLTTEEEGATTGSQIGKYISYGVMAYDGLMMMRKLKRNYGSLLSIFRR